MYHSITIEQAAQKLNADLEKGLTHKEAAQRLEKYGSNLITQGSIRSAWQILLSQFKSPIVYLLLFATAVSFWFQEWLDASAILVVLFVNSIIGFYMEYRAQKSMLSLRRLSSVLVKAFRDGKIYEINSDDIVPGDVVFVEAGDVIPADTRIIRSAQLLIDESALTGESVPVEKSQGILNENTILAERTNSAYKGTHVSKGNAYLLVHSTGMNTELGAIANLVQSSEQAATPLEKKLEDFSKKLIKITVALVVIILIAGFINGQNFLEMLETSIALAVAAIPEGLPIVATLALAQGMLKMAQYNVIVKKLSAVETLGGTNIICTDKTGTLTQNKMEVVFIAMPGENYWKKEEEFTGNKEIIDEVINCSALCNTAQVYKEENQLKESGDPLEIALLRWVIDQKHDIAEIRNNFPKKDEEPFNSETRIMATLHQKQDKYYVYAKGAAEELLLKCTHIWHNEKMLLDEAAREKWLMKAQEYAASGQRLVALAYSENETEPNVLTENLTFLGLVGMIDPPRPEVLQAIADCKTAGIKVVMITGDHPSTAQYIGNHLGISKAEEKPITGKGMKEYASLNDEDKKLWLSTSVFARVNPKHKLDLVSVFQEKGFIVAMTGDGVNDAPALKKADIGIAMGQKGTQVAQEVADMVLQDDSFSSIAVAIRQGRIIFDNIKKFVTFLLSCNLSELLVVAAAAVLNLHFQLIPLQILFINLITDVLPALALSLTKGNSNIMQQKPRNTAEPIINSRRWKIIFFYAFVIASASIAAVFFNHYVYHKNNAWDVTMCNNILFFTLIFSQLFHVFNMGDGPFYNNEVIKNSYVWYATTANILILIIVLKIPFARQTLGIILMTWAEWKIILTASFGSVFIIQLIKSLKILK